MDSHLQRTKEGNRVKTFDKKKLKIPNRRVIGVGLTIVTVEKRDILADVPGNVLHERVITR